MTQQQDPLAEKRRKVIEKYKAVTGISLRSEELATEAQIAKAEQRVREAIHEQRQREAQAQAVPMPDQQQATVQMKQQPTKSEKCISLPKAHVWAVFTFHWWYLAFAHYYMDSRGIQQANVYPGFGEMEGDLSIWDKITDIEVSKGPCMFLMGATKITIVTAGGDRTSLFVAGWRAGKVRSLIFDAKDRLTKKKGVSDQVVDDFILALTDRLRRK